MNDSKNLILAVVLSALVLLGWTWAANKYFPASNPPSTKVENGHQQPLPQAQPTATAPKAMQSRDQVLASTPRLKIETPSLQGSINLKGAQIDDLLLVRQNKMDDAAEQFTRCLALRSDYAPALNELGAIRAQQQKVTEAEHFFHEAIQLNPGFAGRPVCVGVGAPSCSQSAGSTFMMAVVASASITT